MTKKFGRTYRVPWRRRREGKTDYYARYRMLLSGKIRVVIRKSLRNIIIQFVKAEIGGDKTLSFTSSMELKSFGWRYSCGNVPAAYLAGFLAGLKARQGKMDSAILDIGPQSSTYGSRLYAAVRGLVDAGIQIPHDPKIFPSDDRVLGMHIKTFAEKLDAGEREKYKYQFSFYLSKKIDPKKIPENFVEVIDKIAKKFNAKIPDWIREGGANGN